MAILDEIWDRVPRGSPYRADDKHVWFELRELGVMYASHEPEPAPRRPLSSAPQHDSVYLVLETVSLLAKR